MVTGRKPEDFETIARRYIQQPKLIHPKLKIGSKLEALAGLAKMMVTRAPDLDRWERDRGYPILKDPELAQDSVEWRSSAQRKELNLLPVSSREQIADWVHDSPTQFEESMGNVFVQEG